LRSVYSQATILVHLVNNFALMSNLEADDEYGNSVEQPAPVEPYDMCVKLASDFHPQAGVTGKRIEVDRSAFERAFGDRNLLVMPHLTRQAITNLILNALKYGDSKTKIVIDALRTAPAYGIRVASQGIPIGESERELIFGRNYRGVEARQRVPAGTGIGLYLVRHIMKRQDGNVELETRGRHSAFVLLFPARAAVEGSSGADTVRG
jgi:signal transduction histidine kinase